MNEFTNSLAAASMLSHDAAFRSWYWVLVFGSWFGLFVEIKKQEWFWVAIYAACAILSTLKFAFPSFCI